MSREGLGISAAEQRRRLIDATRVRHRTGPQSEQYERLKRHIALAFKHNVKDTYSRECLVELIGRYYRAASINALADRIAQRLEDDGVVKVTWTDSGKLEQMKGV